MDDFWNQDNKRSDDFWKNNDSKNSNNKKNNERGHNSARLSLICGIFSIISVFLMASNISAYGSKLIMPAAAITLAIISRRHAGRFYPKAMGGLVLGIIMAAFVLLSTIILVTIMNNPDLYKQYIDLLKSMQATSPTN